MTIPGRRRWTLWRVERALRRADPHLAVMLAIFARLTAGETIASIEQRNAARRFIRRALAGLGRMLAGLGRMLAAVAARARQAVRRAGYVGIALRHRFFGSVSTSPPS